MAVSNATPRVEYVGNGVLTKYSFTFVVPANTDPGSNINTISNVTGTATSNVLITADQTFTTEDVGKVIVVIGAGSGGADLNTTVLSYTNSNAVVLSDAVETTVANTTANITTGLFGTTMKNNADIEVYVDGALQTYTTNYTVTLNSGDDSNKQGNIDFVSAPANASSIVIKRDVELERTTDFQTAGAFRATTVNQEFDTVIMAVQDSQSTLESSYIHFPDGEVVTTATLPNATSRANKVLQFDSSGEIVVDAFGNTAAADSISGDAVSGGTIDNVSIIDGGTITTDNLIVNISANITNANINTGNLTNITAITSGDITVSGDIDLTGRITTNHLTANSTATSPIFVGNVSATTVNATTVTATTGNLTTVNATNVNVSDTTTTANLTVNTGATIANANVTSGTANLGNVTIANANVTTSMTVGTLTYPTSHNNVDGQAMTINTTTNTISFTNSAGTVTNVQTGLGLTGGPITSQGTISLQANLSDLGDVSVVSPVANSILVYNTANSQFEVGTAVLNLGDLQDVDTTGATANSIIVYNSSNAQFEIGSPVLSINELTDVDTTGVANNDILVYNSGNAKFEVGTQFDINSLGNTNLSAMFGFDPVSDSIVSGTANTQFLEYGFNANVTSGAYDGPPLVAWNNDAGEFQLTKHISLDGQQRPSLSKHLNFETTANIFSHGTMKGISWGGSYENNTHTIDTGIFKYDDNSNAAVNDLRLVSTGTNGQVTFETPNVVIAPTGKVELTAPNIQLFPNSTVQFRDTNIDGNYDWAKGSTNTNANASVTRVLYDTNSSSFVFNNILLREKGLHFSTRPEYDTDINHVNNYGNVYHNIPGVTITGTGGAPATPIYSAKFHHNTVLTNNIDLRMNQVSSQPDHIYTDTDHVTNNSNAYILSGPIQFNVGIGTTTWGNAVTKPSMNVVALDGTGTTAIANATGNIEIHASHVNVNSDTRIFDNVITGGSITTESNGDIELYPHGTGKVKINQNTELTGGATDGTYLSVDNFNGGTPIGFGYPSPGVMIASEGTGGFRDFPGMILHSSSASTGYSSIWIQKNNSDDRTSGAYCTDGQRIFAFFGAAWDNNSLGYGVDYYNKTCAIEYKASETHSASGGGGKIEFYTELDGNWTATGELQMTIDQGTQTHRAFGAATGTSFGTFAISDTTPSVAGGNLWKTFNGTVTITDFDDGIVGQFLTIISEGAVTYDVTGTNLWGGTTDIVTAAGDVTTWVYDGTYWYLTSFIDNSTDLSGGI